MIFIDNKYTKYYFNIITKAQYKNRVKTESFQFETHHIIPTALGGENKPNNLVNLTLREHFIVHLLLTKMLVGKDKHLMSFALSMLMNTRKENHIKSSRLYEYARIQFKEALTDYWTPERREARAELTSRQVKGRKLKESTKEKLRNKVWSQKALDSRLANCLKNAEARKGKPWSLNKRSANRLSYMKQNWKLSLAVGKLKDNGLNNSQISRELNISWDKVKYMLLYRDEFNTYIKSCTANRA